MSAMDATMLRLLSGEEIALKGMPSARAGMVSERPGILLIGNFLSESLGTRFVCEDLAHRLGTRGWRVITASSQVSRIRRLGEMLATVWRRRGDYVAAQVDLYSGAAFVWAEAVCGLLHRLGKPYALTLHGGNLPEFAARWPRRVRRLLMSADTVTAPSPFMIHRLKLLRPDLAHLPNPLDLDRYQFRLKPFLQPRLVWLRAFHSIYNPQLAVRTLAELIPRHPDATLVMVGRDTRDGTLRETESLARALGVRERVEIRGGVPKTEVPAWLDRGEIFLNTANVDNAPVCLVEAMASGVAPVTTNVGGIPFLVRDREEAVLVARDDAREMASAVRLLLSDPALAQTVQRNGRRKAEEFDWANVLPQWERIFVAMMGREMARAG